MTHMLTASGAEYHFTGPSAIFMRPVLVQDIAHHLAQINRFTGAASRPYSVAEHALLVSHIAELKGESPSVQLACLHHDSHEMVTGDLNSPAKTAVNHTENSGAWFTFEAGHAFHFRRELDLSSVFAGARGRIELYDHMALALERRDLTAYDPARHAPWHVLRDGQPDAILPLAEQTGLSLNTDERMSATWQDWRRLFLERHDALSQQVAQQVQSLVGEAQP